MMDTEKLKELTKAISDFCRHNSDAEFMLMVVETKESGNNIVVSGNFCPVCALHNLMEHIIKTGMQHLEQEEVVVH